MASWASAASDGPARLLKLKDVQADGEQHIALVEGCELCSEQELRTHLSPYGPIAWCNSVDRNCYLVRFLSKQGLEAAIKASDSSSWHGSKIKVTHYPIGSLLSGQHGDGPESAESISAVVTGQLHYLDTLLSEQQPNQQQPKGSNVQQPSVFQPAPRDLEPCIPEWNPSATNELLAPLEDEVLSADDSPLHSFNSGASTSQLWTQRSIGAVARKDLAKFAALQSMVHQHSSSSTPQPGLMHTTSLGVGSPWGSFTAGSGSSAEVAANGLAELVRRVSSPAGQSDFTPRSNGSFTTVLGSTMADSAASQQQQMHIAASDMASAAGISNWPNHILQLPRDLGLGDAVADESNGMMSFAAQQQAGQQLLQSSFTSETMSALLAGGLLGAGFTGDVIGRAVDSNGDLCGLLGSSMQPPPPPPAQQHGMPAPPPPPPRCGNAEAYNAGYVGSDGRLSGAASPVPAPPPPRALTPGAGTPAPGQVWAPSPAASPRFNAPPQPQSPCRPPRVATRLFQPGMSNLGHCSPGLHPQLSYDAAIAGVFVPQPQQVLPTAAFNQPIMQSQQQPQPPYRAGSPVNRGGGTPQPPMPPPPPSMPPGYAAASAAAAANGICGSPVPPLSPAGRPGTMAGPLPGMQSCPPGMLEAMSSGLVNSRGSAAVLPHHAPSAALGDRPGQTAAGTAPVYKADGALFVQELLLLLRNGAAAGNTFLSNLKDLLECAVAASTAAAQEENANEADSSEEQSRAANATSAKPAAPVDASAFLGMLQEAAAPLIAAAVAGAVARNSILGNQSRRGSFRMSEIANGLDSSTSSGGSSTAGAAKSCGAQSDPGKALKPIRTGRESSMGGEHALADLDTPPGLLLRNQLAGRVSNSLPGSPMFYPLHPRTTTSGGKDGYGASSCGGAAPGTPHGTPMLLVPQTLPELLSARAALVRLMIGAHSFVQSPAYVRMASKLDGVASIYDSMHDDPVVVKRRKCKDMAAMREAIKQDQAFSQSVTSLSSLRNHIYSLSRKVLIGYGHVEGLPVDLLLGGLTSELAAILNDASGQLPPGMTDGQSSTGGSERGEASDNRNIQSCLPQPVMDFFSCTLPLSKLALLVFTEFVPVDPAPCCMTPAPGTPAASTPTVGVSTGGIDLSATTSNGSISSNTAGGSGGNAARGSNLRHSRRSSRCDSNTEGGFDHGKEAAGSVQHERRNSYRLSKDGEGYGCRDNERNNSQAGRNKGSSSVSGNGSNSSRSSDSLSDLGSGKQQQRVARRSQQCEFDLVAEAAALEAAATAAAPLVAAAVCDLPAGSRKRGSNAGV